MCNQGTGITQTLYCIAIITKKIKKQLWLLVIIYTCKHILMCCQVNKTCTTAVARSKFTEIAIKHHISTLLHKTSTIAMYMQGEGFCQD